MLQSLDASEGRELRDFFRDSGYTTAALQQRFNSVEIPQLHLIRLFSLGLPLEASRLNLLFRWFWIGMPVDTTTAGAWIPKQILDLLIKTGILLATDTHLTPTVRISPFAQYFIVSDHAIRQSGTSSANTILWPNPTTLLCYHLSLRSPGVRTLDLGTGNGILALASAEHSTRVIATDLNSRARQFCLFNAALNGVSNVEFREGSAFEPVAGERFDLILANPPFFVTPSVRRLYSDNAMELDDFCSMLVRQAPLYLNEGGYCQILLEWVEFVDQPWPDRLNGWFEALGCDVWLFHLYRRSAADYAMLRVYEDRDDLLSAQAQAAQTTGWQTYFQEKQVNSIHGGILVLRKRTGTNWIRMEEMRSPPGRPAGAAVRRGFETLDTLQRCTSDDQLLLTRPVLPASTRLQKHSAICPQGWKLTSLELHSGEGLSSSIALQPGVADFSPYATAVGRFTRLLTCLPQTWLPPQHGSAVNVAPLSDGWPAAI